MPPLTTSRANPAPAFDCTGIDLLGPILVKDVNKPSKRWLTLFTCLITCAIHLVVTSDLSAVGFIDTFKRLIARRGLPSHILSDNGSNLVLTAKVLKQLPETRTIFWNFITAFTPWQGGIYERLIGLTKSSLKRAIGCRSVTDSELRTLATEVEAVFNERPLTYVGNDSLTILRPIDYMRPRAHRSIAVKSPEVEDPSFDPNPTNTRSQLMEQWSRSEECRNKFWTLWQREYFHLLRDRSQRFHRGPHTQQRRTPQIGEIVLLHNEATPRGTSKPARIISVPTGISNTVRTARIKTSSGRCLTRTIAQLYPLEVHDDTNKTKHQQSKFLTAEEQRATGVSLPKTGSQSGPELIANASVSKAAKANSTSSFFLLTVLMILVPSINIAIIHAKICPYRYMELTCDPSIAKL